VSLPLLLGALACAVIANAATNPTSTVLTANTSVAYSGAPVSLEAVVTAGGSTKVIAGQVIFQDGVRMLAVAQGVKQANGSLTAAITARLTGGVEHSLTATYLGAPTSTSATAPSTSAPISVQIISNLVAASTITVTESGPTTLSATVATNGTIAPSGNVTFVDQSLGQTLGTVAISASSVAPLFSGPSWPTGQGPGPLVSADFNNDGLPDLAVVNTLDGTVSVFISNAAQPGQFLPPQVFGVGPNPSAIVTADFNADGVLDLAVANGDSSITLLFGTNSPGKLFTSSTVHPGVPVGSILVAADLNGDGLPDLVFAAASIPKGDAAALDVLFNTAATPGTFSATPTVIGLSTPLHYLAAADFNVDGFTDLVVDNAVYMSNGEPAQFQAPQVFGYPCGCPVVLAGMTVADLNSDGIPDVVLLGSSSATDVFVDVVLSNATTPGQFLPVAEYPWPATTSSLYTPTGVAVAPLNANGIPDIFSFGRLTGRFGTSLIAALNSGIASSLGTFSPVQTFSPPAGLTADFLLLDLNADGFGDLAFTESASDELVTAFGSLSATVLLSDVAIGGSGQQFITASYSGNSTIPPASSTVLQLAGSGPRPASVLMVPSTLTEWTNLGLTVSVSVSNALGAVCSPSGPCPLAMAASPTGTVTLWNGAVQLDTAALDTSGNAVFSPTLAPGAQNLSITYSGDANFAPASSSSTIVQVYGSSNAAVFNANPNPIQAAPGVDGQTTISWSLPAGVSEIQVTVNAPNGQEMAQATTAGSEMTGQWVTDGMVFYLQDVSGGKALTAANTIATIRIHLQPDTTFWANPNPIPVAPGSTAGISQLIWSAPNTVTSTEVTIGAPNGSLFGGGGASGIFTTGPWVTNGMTFYLQNVTGGDPLTAQYTLDSLVASLQPQVMFSASPNPVSNSFLQNNQQVGSTTLSWNAPNSTSVSIRIGSPSGPVLGTGGTSGTMTASAVVTQGTVFYLEDVSGGALNGTILGSVTVNLQSPVQFTATPNPITAISVVSGVEQGSTTLQWNAPGQTSVAIFFTPPNSNVVETVATGGATGSVTVTAQDGNVYLLEDTSVTPPVVIGSQTIHLQHQVQFTAGPNPAPILYSSGPIQLGQTTLTWNAMGVTSVEITIGAPNGRLFGAGGPSGSYQTGVWVTNGMTFYLQDVTGGKPLTADNTLATVTVQLQ
jgi:hypothetical protein